MAQRTRFSRSKWRSLFSKSTLGVILDGKNKGAKNPSN
jgi:hypothetical protein